MYDELVKRLRNDATAFVGFVEEDLRQAADALEELSAIREEQKANIILMAAEIEEKQPRWIPVTERLPEKNQIVVVVQHGKTWDYGQFRGLAYLGGNIHKWNWKNNTTKTVDYWMPKKSALPEPPKEET